MEETQAGEWTGFTFPVKDEDLEVFEKVTSQLIGVRYTPFAVASQLVSGKNYCFIAGGEAVMPVAPQSVAQIYVYLPLKGDPHITEIKRLNP